jgi:hypothetical protein
MMARDAWPTLCDILKRVNALEEAVINPLIQEPVLMRRCVVSHLRGISQVIDAFRAASSEENPEQFKD